MTAERRKPSGKRKTHITRSSSTGQYTIQIPSADGGYGTIRPGEKRPQSPRTFIEEFTSSPVVDEVMRRLSR